MIEEETEYTFESNVSDFELVSPKSVSCENIKVEMATLRELAAPNFGCTTLINLISYFRQTFKTEFWILKLIA